MPLLPGTRLGPYEIVAPLGAGGMGEVYRARDTRLGREVAIKVLPQHLSENAEVRARFEREAKTVSSLNHPNICTLFDVGREPGEGGSGGTDYLVMELVEGETLAARLARGPLPIADVLRVGSQIADALDRAHRAGVIHRDLKPGNVMLTRSGAKLMDFGLARATGLGGPASGSGATAAAMTRSPTVAQPLTAEGTIVGTFQYMAPEQLEGREADALSDVWGLGCVLYEMATGRRAFEGSTQASLISSIMRDVPRSIAEIATLSPPALDRLVRACLAKDPESRLQSVHDVKLQLEWMGEPSSAAGVPAPAADATPATPARPSRERLAWTVAGICAVLAVAALLVPRFLSHPAASPPIRVSILPPEDAVIDSDPMHTAVSPDGRTVTFVATDTTGTSQLWIRRMEEPEARRLPGTENAILPFWSPDSRSIGFFAGGKLRRVDVEGRNVQTLCDAPDGRGASWNRNGLILFSPSSESPLFRVSEGGGTPRPVLALDSTRQEGAQRFPTFLPDGRRFLYVSLTQGDTIQTRLGTLDSKTTRPVLTSDEMGAMYAAPGFILFSRDGALLAQHFDARSARLQGEPRSLGASIAFASRYNGCLPASVSTNGVLVQRLRRPSLTGLEWFDRQGHDLGAVPIAPAQYTSPSLSPDDGHLAVTRNSPDTGADVWSIDLTRGIATRLTVDRTYCESPIWSPDGRWIWFAYLSQNARFFGRVPGAGAGEPEVMLQAHGPFDNPAAWSPDGRTLLVRTLSPTTGEDVWAVPGGRDSVWTPVLQSRHHEEDPAFSPDGHWIAFRSDESGRPELYVQSFPDPSTRVRVSHEGAGTQVRSPLGHPFWRRDGRELLYVSGDGSSVMSVPVETAGGLHVGTPRAICRLPATVYQIAATSDLQRFLAIVNRSSEETASIQVVLNWPSEFAKR